MLIFLYFLLNLFKNVFRTIVCIIFFPVCFQELGTLKKINMCNSRYLKEIPDLSDAKNLEKLYLFGCKSLVTLHSSIQSAINLRRLNLGECTMLESFPTHATLNSLEYLNLRGCSRLINFPQISLYNSTGFFWSEFVTTTSYLEQ